MDDLEQIFLSIANPVLEIMRPIPPLALAPFFINWFGLEDYGQVAVITLGCLMTLAVSTFVSVHNVPPVYIRAASSLGASKLHIYRTIIVPAILPSLVSGLRIAAALAFGLAAAAEIMGAQSGLGFLIVVAKRTLETDTILLAALILGLESYLMDRGIRLISNYVCRWSETPIHTLQRIEIK